MQMTLERDVAIHPWPSTNNYRFLHPQTSPFQCRDFQSIAPCIASYSSSYNLSSSFPPKSTLICVSPSLLQVSQQQVLAGVLLLFSRRRSTARWRDGSLKRTGLEPGPRGTANGNEGKKTPKNSLPSTAIPPPESTCPWNTHSLGNQGVCMERRQSNLYHIVQVCTPKHENHWWASPAHRQGELVWLQSQCLSQN